MKNRKLLNLLYVAFAGFSAGLSPGISSGAQEEITINVAGYYYDRVRAIIDGRASIEGENVNFSIDNIYDLNGSAFGSEQKYEVTELGLIPYITQYINNDFRDYTLVPVFISRIFRHGNVFIRAGSGIEKPEDLKGQRVCTVGYGMSASTWIRGFLSDEYGVKASDMQWIEATQSSDGGTLNSGFAQYYFDDDFPLTQGPEGVDESELLLSGACNALITAITPRGFLEGDPRIERLFPDVRVAEQAYYEKTKLFPIMHVIAIRNDAIKANPDLPRLVFEMYSDAKQAAYADLETTTSLKVTLPWVLHEYEETRRRMGKNYWKYGIEANRKELQSIMRYVYEQGLVERQVNFEDLFYPSTMELGEDIK